MSNQGSAAVEMSAGNRMPSGRKRIAQPRHAGANNLAKRVHEGFRTMVKLGMRAEWASVVGRLFLDGQLTELEVQAAYLYAGIAARYDNFHTVADRIRRTSRSQAYEASRGELDVVERHRVLGTVPDYERMARRAQAKWRKAQIADDHAGRHERMVQDIVDRACIYDEHVRADEVVWLKEGLGFIARQFALEVYAVDAMVENRQREREMPLPRRVAMAIEAVTQWLRDEGATPMEFRVGASGERKRGIQVWGQKRDGTEVSHVVLIRIKTRDIVAAIDSQFQRSAVALRWKERTEA